MSIKTSPEEYDNFDMTLEECRLVFDTFQNLIITDEKGRIKYLSPDMYFMVEAYNKRPVPNNVVGRPINEIHPTSKINSVLETGVPSKNTFYFASDITNVARIEPLYKDGKLVGAMDYDIFTDGHELKDFLDKLTEYSAKGMTNFVDDFHTMYDASKENEGIKYSITDFIGGSDAAHRVRRQIGEMSESDVTVLITGETGCGKEIVAHAIHNTSRRCKERLVAVNCAAIPRDLVESELFGYEEGAFTGAQKGGKKGLLELADGGTIFLDEINQLPYHVQPKLLRVLQEREVRPIGGEVRPVDIRVIAASNKDLWEMVRSDEFREDLYYRLNVMEINIPPLRERKEDIPMLIASWFEQTRQKSATPVKDVSAEVRTLFLKYDWPGNVRELYNLLERSIIFCKGEVLEAVHLGNFVNRVVGSDLDITFSSDSPLEEIKARAEEQAIRQVLKVTGNNRSKAAAILKISRTALYDKIRKYRIV